MRTDEELSVTDLSAFLIGVLLWNILPTDLEEGVYRDEDEDVQASTTVELGRLDGPDASKQADMADDSKSGSGSSTARVQSVVV